MRFLILTITAALFLGCNPSIKTNTAVNNSTVTDTANSGVTNSSQSPTPHAATPATTEPIPSTKPLPPDAQAVQSAIEIVHEYYDAINARNFQKAYELWSEKDKASKKTFEEFRRGFANTASVQVDTGGQPSDLEGAAGSQYVEIPVRIRAKTKDGEDQSFWGRYVLRRSMVDGATPEQRSWRIYSAEIHEQ